MERLEKIKEMNRVFETLVEEANQTATRLSLSEKDIKELKDNWRKVHKIMTFYIVTGAVEGNELTFIEREDEFVDWEDEQ